MQTRSVVNSVIESKSSCWISNHINFVADPGFVGAGWEPDFPSLLPSSSPFLPFISHLRYLSFSSLPFPSQLFPPFPSRVSSHFNGEPGYNPEKKIKLEIKDGLAWVLTHFGSIIKHSERLSFLPVTSQFRENFRQYNFSSLLALSTFNGFFNL
jgi:hypothetical protein